MKRFLVLFPLLASGCIGMPSADVIDALGRDPATACLQITTIYGGLTLARTNAIDSNIQCGSATLAHGANRANAPAPVLVAPILNPNGTVQSFKLSPVSPVSP